MVSTPGSLSCTSPSSLLRGVCAVKAPTHSELLCCLHHSYFCRNGRRVPPSLSGQQLSVVARADSSVPLHLRKTDTIPKDAARKGNISQISKRVAAGLVMGGIGATLVVQGGVLYLAFIEFFVCQAALEYFGFVAAVDKKEGSPVTPKWVTSLVTVCCMALPLYSFVSGGKIGLTLALFSFALLSVLGAGLRTPRMSTLSSAMFGLLYCGYLPTFWLKVRMLSDPVVNSQLALHWPAALGGIPQITVGMAATFVPIACVVASDVGGFTVGKLIGRTPLSAISPNKTVEGALGGLSMSVLTAVMLSRLFGWPMMPLAAVGLGVAVSLSAVLGDLIESAMKRDAGMKDSAVLIPGHGGILDRFDSYIFTGAIVYLYIMSLPLLGM